METASRSSSGSGIVGKLRKGCEVGESGLYLRWYADNIWLFVHAVSAPSSRAAGRSDRQAVAAAAFSVRLARVTGDPHR
jgi:hypothetical protein